MRKFFYLVTYDCGVGDDYWLFTTYKKAKEFSKKLIIEDLKERDVDLGESPSFEDLIDLFKWTAQGHLEISKIQANTYISGEVCTN